MDVDVSKKHVCIRIAFWASKGPNPRGRRRFENSALHCHGVLDVEGSESSWKSTIRKKHICMVSLGRPTVCLIPDEKSKESSLTCVQSSHGAQRRKTPLKPLRPNWAGVYWRAGHFWAYTDVLGPNVLGKVCACFVFVLCFVVFACVLLVLCLLFLL